ncbi:hypothetical protein RJ639_044805 [Escallonia herrerae]|uniref:UTP--glucose-1-phosphate uridylyltransferase n=1 Tax=Escallonia herrerae TaxID=1293975 RepID=A0AA88WF70_9ASTE|nr:hypothetical protein RJ639_044805 [Escallonia herrerae]
MRRSPSEQNEVLLSLKSSGKLDVLLSQGKEYVLLLNSDNLADVVDQSILLTPASLAKVEEKSPQHEGKFKAVTYVEIFKSAINVLESRALLPHDEAQATLEHSWRWWLNLKAINHLAERKALKKDPIIKFFDSAIGINVPHSRYLPVESTSDLLILQSDLYNCIDGVLTRNRARANPANPCIELGPEFEEVGDFHSRFKSIPSMIELDSLKVNGDVWFGTGITLKGKVSISAQPGMKIVIPDDAVLEDKDINGPGEI